MTSSPQGSATTRVAFFGLSGTFEYGQIGGIESIIRRLTAVLTERGAEVTLIQYNAAGLDDVTIGPRIHQKRFPRLEQAFAELRTRYDHVISIYLRPRDRLAYARFRRRQRDSIRFHHLYSVWHERRLRRELVFAEARLAPFNGGVLSVSPRLHRYVSRWAERSLLLLPPVPREYFCRPEDKRGRGKLRVTYAGRLDPAKGAGEALEVFRGLARRDDVEARIVGYTWSHDSETLRMRNTLQGEPNLMVDVAEHRGWSGARERKFQEILRETDILLLPYLRLSSTVDMPLLLLEGMANLCAIVTPALGALGEVYGPSWFLLPGAWDRQQAVQLIDGARPFLEAERQRLRQRNTALRFSSEDIGQRLQGILGAGE